MIAPYHFSYSLRDLSAALSGLRRPFPEVRPGWFPLAIGEGLKAFPCHRGREAQYALLRALDLPANARVGVPLFTHPVVWQTIAAAGMQPVFIDSDPLTYGPSLPDLLKKKDSIDCLILIHTFGYPADFDQVAAIMEGKPILEDCAHTLGSTYRGRSLGTLADGSFFTFLFSKPLSAGGGGCAIARNPHIADRVQSLLRERADESWVSGLAHALVTFLFALAYQPPFYSVMTRLTHVGSYRRTARKFVNHVSPLLHMRRSDWGAVASRLQRWDTAAERNAEFWEQVRTHLPPGWYIPPEPRLGKWNHWLLPVCPPSAEVAAFGIAELRRNGVGVGLIYDDCLDAAPPYGYSSGYCPVAERLSRCVFLLPAHSALSFRERRHILDALRRLNEQRAAAAPDTVGIGSGVLSG